ncbi:cytochrome P450 [Kutzneria kofuensis]|uniref:Cytochrome P450 n=1 Tax=Kutzneria kofuensis TaxID=103725 RepID=A0A7W9KAS0_9PSEU|nr:cytochrome P450 [Kutzneria kofuensis]MBB5889152.1 cytochrome P450 [Kutzneria kofuensis]
MTTPLEMARDRFDPSPALREVAARPGLPRITSLFGPARLAVRHEDVRTVYGNSVEFSNGIQSRLQGTEDVGFILGYDPPAHTRLRRMLTPEFTLRRMRAMRPRVVEIVDSALSAMAAAGPGVDLVAEFALPVPSLVICELLGVPYEDRATFQRLTSRQLDFAVPLAERTQAGEEMGQYLAGLVERHMRAPGEDVIGTLITLHGDDLSFAELVGLANMLLIAGHETTSNMLGLGSLLLLENPAQLALLRDDPDVVEGGIEELLRYLSVVHFGVPREVVTDLTVGGTALTAGELVLCSIILANRDPALVPDADRFDVTRKPMPHLAFGHGIHHCVGAPLARLEMSVAFPALLRRFPGLRLAVPSAEIEFRTTSPVYGVQALPVAW